MDQPHAADVAAQTTLLRVAAAIARRARLILVCGLVGAALAAVWSLTAAQRFRATAKFALEEQAAGATPGGLAALASQFGAGSLGGTRSLQFYADVLTSRDLLEAAARDSLPVPGSPTRRASLMDVLGVRGDTPARRMDNAVMMLQRGAISVSTNDRTGTVTLNVVLPDPHLAAQVAQRLYQLLERFNYERRRSAASERRRFAERELARARTELTDAERVMQSFLETNRAGLDAPRLSFERERINRQVQVAADVYRTLSNELQEARIAEVRDTPVFTLIETPEPPVDRDFPNRKRITFLGAVLGVALAAAWVGFRSTGWSARRLDPVGYEQLARALHFRRNRPAS